MQIQNSDGKYVTVTLKLSKNIKQPSVSGILDSSGYPIVFIDGKLIFADDITGYTVGNPKNYEHRNL
jgi:hypothetical protein